MNLKIRAIGLLKGALQQTGANIPSLWGRYSSDASHLVDWYDFDKEDICVSQSLMKKDEGYLDIKRIIWFIPEFDNPFWGGIHTIFRFASYLKETKNIQNCFVVIGNVSEGGIKEGMVKAFPALRDEKICILSSESEMRKINEADASICTLWTTAYHSLKFNKVKRKFYFIQDYESLFYPAGSTSAQVEETYRFGFRGIANTITLKNIYEDISNCEAEFFTPSVDPNVFYPNPDMKTNERFTVFFYGRPGHPRNGFELGIAALKKLKYNMGEKVRIVTAGADWKPHDFGLEGIIENLGLLSYEKTGDLYRKCDVALSMMFTRHPSYIPMQLMASGCLVVANLNPANAWLFHDRENCLLSPASASSLCETIIEGLNNTKLREKIINNALSTINNHTSWDEEMEKIYLFMSK